MAVSLSVIAAKDGAASPAQIAGGGLQAQDKSGTGAGPFTLGHVMIDGLAGTNMAAVTAANAVKVDGSAVTQPVSLSTVAVTNAGTFAVQVTSAPSTAVTNAGTFAVQVSNANPNNRAVPASSAPVVLASQTYKSCLASATTGLGATGAIGDYLDGVLIVPGTAAAGIVQIQDASGTAITVFAGGGTTALPTLAPFYVPVGAISAAGQWKVITNANVTAVAVGNFT